MRVLFLDMDGVMNSERYLIESEEERERILQGLKGFEQWRTHAMRMIDPKTVPLLDEVIERADAHVVVSSTWRLNWTPQQLAGMLRERGGLRSGDRFIDRTPNDRTADEVRGHEIQRWLDKHSEVERFVIVDDDSDMIHLKPRLVQTSWKRGLEREHVERAVKMLRGEP